MRYLLAAALAFALVTACGPQTSQQQTAAPPAAASPVVIDTTPAEPVDATPPPPAQPTYTVPQEQAIASAESYLSDGQGFSKLGLIDQLHSQYGEGFSRRLAVFAVSHIRVNWRHQAVLSAKGYMSSQPGWSFSGLVDQLSSPYGENFTYAQAVYAAHRVGL